MAKLVLNKETLTQLNDASLIQIGGGGTWACEPPRSSISALLPTICKLVPVLEAI
jgi:hypothetical protein